MDATSAPASQPLARIDAITKPSAERKQSFPRPGLIAKVLVKEGQDVKAGDVLVEQDFSAEQVELQVQKKIAEEQDELKIQAAQKTLDSKKVELANIRKADNGASELERERAALDVEIAQLQLQNAQTERKLDTLKVQQLERTIDRMRIRSEIDGKIEEIMVKSGESADALTKVVRVVSIDPLWLDVAMPMTSARLLEKRIAQGQTPIIDVVFPPDDAVADAPQTVGAKVVKLSQVADAAARLRMVRLEVPNPARRPAGERVEVILPVADKNQQPADVAKTK